MDEADARGASSDLNPWCAPILQATGRSVPRHPRPLAEFLGLATSAGAIAAGAAFVIYATAYERYVIQSLPAAEASNLHSYGLKSVVALILVVLLGAATGLGVVAVRYAVARVAFLIPAIISPLVASFIFAAWKTSLKNYGPEPSDAIVFLPPLLASGVTMLLVVVGGVSCLFRSVHRPLVKDA